NRVVRLEEPRAGAEGVHHAEEGRERHEAEPPHAKLHRDLASLVIHRLASPSAAARTATFIDSPRLRLRLALPHSSTHLASPARKAWTAPSVVSSTASTGPIVANRPSISTATRSATVLASSRSCVTRMRGRPTRPAAPGSAPRRAWSLVGQARR